MHTFVLPTDEYPVEGPPLGAFVTQTYRRIMDVSWYCIAGHPTSYYRSKCVMRIPFLTQMLSFSLPLFT